MQYVLDVENLEKYFDDFVAVNNINLKVEEGKFFSILGPSGCGKTTLLRMIAGFTKVSSGSIKIRKKEMKDVAPNKRPINLVFQNLALFPMMNVEENIAFGLKRQNVKKEIIKTKVEEILQKVNLKGYGKKDVTSLSGGQKQRVAIARSLVLEPSILLLDEPLGALDLKLREKMKIELKKLQVEFGTTFIYITHDQSEALVMSDMVAVMNNGAFEQIDTPKNLYSNPKTSFVASFVGENNMFQANVTSTSSVKIKEGIDFKVNFITECKNECKLFIRPESIILKAKNNQENLNYFDVEVLNILFDGSNTKILCNILNSSHEIQISLPQNQEFSDVKIGDIINAAVSISDCKVFEK